MSDGGISRQALAAAFAADASELQTAIAEQVPAWADDDDEVDLFFALSPLTGEQVVSIRHDGLEYLFGPLRELIVVRERGGHVEWSRLVDGAPGLWNALPPPRPQDN
jgi:hypothetical protein